VSVPIITTSERSALNRCPQQWWWRYRMGLRPRGEKGDARWFGIGVHLALAEWYGKGKKRGRHPALAFSEYAGDEIAYVRTLPDQEGDPAIYEDALDLGISMLNSYIENYGRDSQWNVLEIEQPFQVQIKWEGEHIADFHSTFDGAVRDEADGQIYLLEHKTATQVNTAYLALDPQAGSYWAVATSILRSRGIIGPGESISGIIYNFLRKCKKDERPRNSKGLYLNKDGGVSKRQPAPAFVREVIERGPREIRAEMYALADDAIWMNAMRDGLMPVRKSRTRDCTFCDFFHMCQLHQRGGDSWMELRDAEFLQEDPYDRYREKSAEG
jgi:hypothetical protein